MGGMNIYHLEGDLDLHTGHKGLGLSHMLTYANHSF